MRTATTRATTADKEAVLRDFMTMPNVGPATALDLWNLGYRSRDELKGADPEKMYERLCKFAEVRMDRCVLYTFRAVVYLASTPTPAPDRIMWWHWKDTKDAAPQRNKKKSSGQR
jgi:hypothetical protein